MKTVWLIFLPNRQMYFCTECWSAPGYDFLAEENRWRDSGYIVKRIEVDLNAA